ncbi:hypothetical protein U8527_09990 [Kordia algicida OT-1]|uniref:Uncharacterized protein n=1 Tax=Kordia algicida OT-1 TaxID=391587 RepID=A9DVK5_9FLAO|nr:hypothetical protein [Kordia algicida]EDP96433.1 hypothetical protein KAOT1_03452 [Kordia algicida OT-1]
MQPKTKAVLYNFVAFMLIFLAFRLTIGYVLKLNTLWLALISAVIASILAPKFAVVEEGGKKKVMMSSIFTKDHKEV